MTNLVRALRLLKLLKEIHHLNIIIYTVNALFTPFYTLLLVTFMLFYVFASIGDQIFGGKVNKYTIEITRDQSIPDNYVELNFNDFASSFVTLFVLMVVNNWFVVAKMYSKILGHNYIRAFFS